MVVFFFEIKFCFFFCFLASLFVLSFLVIVLALFVLIFGHCLSGWKPSSCLVDLGCFLYLEQFIRF